jgi:hypothetical protein
MSTPEQKAKAKERWNAYYALHKDRLVLAAKQRRENNPEAVREAKRKYYSSEKGKAQKRKEDEAYVASGGRAKAESRRAEKPLSEARKAARKRWSKANCDYWAAQQSKRRTLSRELSVDEFWVLQEAVLLARMREKIVGGKWHVDHITPVSKGGTSEPSNLQVVPADWNRKKSNKHSERFFACA